MIRYATIGTNFIVDWFTTAAKKEEGLLYAAAYSRSDSKAEEFAKKHGAVRISTDLEELAESEDVDAVYIASPTSFHYEQAALMLSHKKHVLCEKPITSNEAELKKLMELAVLHGVVLMEGMRPVHEPGFAAIEAQLPRLGKIRKVDFQYCQYSSRYDKFKNGIVENAFNPEFSNGSLMDIGVYCIHPMVRLFGMPQKIMADAVLLENGIDGAGTILASYDGMIAELSYSKISDSRTSSQIQGEDGSLVIKEINSPYEVIFYDRQGREEVCYSVSREDDMSHEIGDWVRLMEAGESGDSYNQYSLMQMKVLDEVRRQTGIVFPADGRGIL